MNPTHYVLHGTSRRFLIHFSCVAVSVYFKYRSQRCRRQSLAHFLSSSLFPPPSCSPSFIFTDLDTHSGMGSGTLPLTNCPKLGSESADARMQCSASRTEFTDGTSEGVVTKLCARFTPFPSITVLCTYAYCTVLLSELISKAQIRRMQIGSFDSDN